MGTSTAVRKWSRGAWRTSSGSRTSSTAQSEAGARRRAAKPSSSAWMCRICHGDEGWLVAPCACRGSVAWVHRACLERWLSEAGRDSCELCGRTFRTVRLPRHAPLPGFLRWLAVGLDAKQLLLDITLLLVLTPLVVLALYLVVWSARAVTEQTDPASRTSYVLVITMMSSSFVLASYYSWVTATVQQHVSDWRQWWRTNYSVRLLDETPSVPAWRTRLTSSARCSGQALQTVASETTDCSQQILPETASASSAREEVQLHSVSYASVASERRTGRG